MDRLIYLILHHLTKVARPILKWLVGIIFAHGSFLLPVRRAMQSSMTIAFWHPRPGYRIHILLVPKKAVADLADLSYQENCKLLEDVLNLSGQLVAALGLQDCGYSLILNGGSYQGIPQLHFHLIAE